MTPLDVIIRYTKLSVYKKDLDPQYKIYPGQLVRTINLTSLVDIGKKGRLNNIKKFNIKIGDQQTFNFRNHISNHDEKENYPDINIHIETSLERV